MYSILVRNQDVAHDKADRLLGPPIQVAAYSLAEVLAPRNNILSSRMGTERLDEIIEALTLYH